MTDAERLGRALESVTKDPDLLEIARRAIESTLIEWRDSRMSFPQRNNGLVVREADGKRSDLIRMGPETAVRIGLLAISQHLAQGADDAK